MSKVNEKEIDKASRRDAILEASQLAENGDYEAAVIKLKSLLEQGKKHAAFAEMERFLRISGDNDYCEIKRDSGKIR